MPEYSLSAETTMTNRSAGQAAPDVGSAQDNMAKIALLLDQLTKAVVDLRERVGKTESQFSDLLPFLDAMKTHVNSLPAALREARRSDITLQRRIEELSSRVAQIESRQAKEQTAG